jgi:N-acetylneuraminate synthase/N,N'-diacetyllegionaminate synthase
LPEAAYRAIVELCADLGITFLSTPFDEESADFLEDLGVPAYKIASGDITSHRLLRHVAAKKKPILLSTGCCMLGEIEEALGVIHAAGNDQVALLHCTLAYPARIGDANLHMMRTMQAAFPDCPIGLSDHTMGTLVPVVAATHGACVIEKHFTIDKTLGTSTDHFMSVDPGELKAMVRDIRDAVAAMGQREKRPIPAEQDALRYARRSVVARRTIAQGKRIAEGDLCLKRPGTGLPPKLFDVIMGRTAAVNIPADTVLTWDLLR